MERKCKIIHKDLVAYLDGELPEKKSLSVSEHLHTCAACQKEYKDLAASMDLLLAWKNISPTEEYDRIFWQKVKSNAVRDHEKRNFLSMLAALIRQNFSSATSALLAVLLVLITFLQSKPHKEPQLQEIHMAMNMELFLNMKIIENSEALEHFELIEVLDRFEQDLKR